MPLSVRFELSGAGWINIHLARDGASHALTGLSYLTPVLDDVLRAALHSTTADWRGDALFELEPGTMRLRCERCWGSGPETAMVSVAESDIDLMIQAPPETSFKELWRVGIDNADEFASAVLLGAKALEAEHGHAGYADKWVEHAFPVRAAAALEAALAKEPLSLPGRDR